jgi:hypothetical protein
VDKAGVCIKCWKIFRTGDELLAHLKYTCRTSTLSNLGKHAILYDAFAKHAIPRTLEASMPGGSVPFPQDLDQTLIDSDELFDPSFTITSTSPSQTVASQQPEVTLTQKLQVSTLRARDYHTDDKHTASPSPTPSPPSSSTQQPAALPHFQGNSSTAIDFDGKSQQPSAVHSPLPPNPREGHLPGDSDEAERRRNIGELQDSPGDCLPEAPYSLFSDNIATNAVPRIDRSMTDVYSDELYNPHFTMTSAPIASTPTSQALPPMNKFFADRLQAANSQHLSAVHAPAPSRGRSLFLQGSPLAPEPADDLSTTMPPPPVVPRSSKQGYKVPQFPVYDPVSYRLDDDLMLPTGHALLHDGKSSVTDLDVQMQKRAEALFGATEEDKGLWVSDNPADEELEKMLEVGPHEGVTGQSQHGRMEVVYCHGCSREWYREQQADLECPHCHGHFSEIVDMAPAPATDTKGDEAVARTSSAQGPAETPEDHGSLKELAAPPSTLPGPPMLQEKQEHVLQAKLDLEKLELKHRMDELKMDKERRLRQEELALAVMEHKLEDVDRIMKERNAGLQRQKEEAKQHQKENELANERLWMLLTEGGVQDNLRHIRNPVVEDVVMKDIEAMSKKKIELVAPARSGDSKRRPAFDAIDTADDSLPDSTTRLPLFQSPEYAAANVDDMTPIQPLAVDPVGGMKVQENGQLLGCRRYRMRTFLLPEYGDRLFMLAEECRLVLGFTDLESFFAAGAPRFGVIPTEEMINIAHGLPHYVGRQTQVFYVVTARDIFQWFGSRAILHGEAGHDDYWSLPSVDNPAPASETLLPCPFQRRNPRRYRLVKDPACSGHGFKDIADLMDHIKRAHSSKWGCHYCNDRFQGRDNTVEDVGKLHRKECKWYANGRVSEVSQYKPEVMSPEQDKLYFQIDFRHMKGYLAEDKQRAQYWYICMAIWPEYESLEAFNQFYPRKSTLSLRLEL